MEVVDMEANGNIAATEKGGYAHFMLKEIHEQPQALQQTIAPYLETDSGPLANFLTAAQAQSLRKLYIVACGTSHHAGLVGRHAIESLARLSVEVDLASEFRYRNPLLDEHTAVLVISQSGETADTLASLQEAQRRGCPVWAITNVQNSSIAQQADAVLPTLAGTEVAIASTKAYTAQLAVLLLLAVHLAELRQTRPAADLAAIRQGLRELPQAVQAALEYGSFLQGLANQIAEQELIFFMGWGVDYAGALEAALKLKETSYIHAGALAAGELRHGPIALITEKAFMVCLQTQPHLRHRMQGNMQEVLAKGGKILLVDTDASPGAEDPGLLRVSLPQVHPLLAPIVSIVPLQLLAYYVAVARGCNVDKPRNLNKSVTIE